MKNRPLRYLLIAAGAFAALAVVLYFVNPWAPLLLAASLVVQLPIIITITRTNLTAGYRDRAWERRQQYKKDGDAAAWLAAEERETAGVGYKYWSAAARAQCALNRAAALAALGRGDEAAALLADITEKQLPDAERARFEETVDTIRQPAKPAPRRHTDDPPAESNLP